MTKFWVILLAFFLPAAGFSQSAAGDSTLPAKPTDSLGIIPVDTTDYDALFQDFDAFMDSILAPHSYFMGAVSMSRGYYNFESKTTELLDPEQKMTYSPLLGYYSKKGWGLTATGLVVHDGENLNLYQWGITPSFDYLANRKFAAGIAYTRFFTKDSLPFYTTPIQNEVSAYFTWRKWWIKPGISVSYGWGSRKEYEARETLIQDLRLRRRGFTYINTKETIGDFSVATMVRHDFYWLDVLAFKDHIRVTPQLVFTCGTQKFGFNQSSSTYGTTIRTSSNVLYSTDNLYLDDKIEFQPLSLTFNLRTEYSIGKFFIQPQAIFDYYFPAPEKNFNALFSLNLGFVF